MPRQVIDLAPPSYQFNDAPLIGEGIWRAAQSIANAPAHMAQIRMQQEDRAGEQQMRQLQMRGMQQNQDFGAQAHPIQMRQMATNADLGAVNLTDAQGRVKHDAVMRPLTEQTAQIGLDSLKQTAPVLTAEKIAKADQSRMNIPLENRGLEADTSLKEFKAKNAPAEAQSIEEYRKAGAQGRTQGKQLTPKLTEKDAYNRLLLDQRSGLVNPEYFPGVLPKDLPAAAAKRAKKESQEAGFYDSSTGMDAAPAPAMNVPGANAAPAPAEVPVQTAPATDPQVAAEVGYHMQQLAPMNDADQQAWLRQLKKEKPEVFQALLTETANARNTR